MPTAAPPSIAAAPHAAPSTTADRMAGRYWRANLAALAKHSPAQAADLAAVPFDGTWCLARDGSLSARNADGSWFAGCSVPVLAGRALLRSLAIEPGGHCLLAPAFAGLITAARERLGPDPVLFVIQPDPTVCRVMLSTCDLSAELAAGTLWFATGDGWPTAFHRTFDDHPGLAAPARFIQTLLTPAPVAEPLIAEAQRVIGAIATSRAAALVEFQRPPRPIDPGRTVVLAGSRFRLWQHCGVHLLGAVQAACMGEIVVHDTDDPLTATPLAFAPKTAGAAAIVVENLSRADVAAPVAADTRWITWQTHAAAGSTAGGPGDHLIVADPAWRDAAIARGWATDRVHVGIHQPTAVVPVAGPTAIGIIADTFGLDAPDAVQEYSSHHVLWDAIAAELQDEPLAVSDPAAYLTDRSRQMGIDPAELNFTLFTEGLILPAHVQGLARHLIARGLPVHLWGQGWADLPEFSSHAAGTVTDQTTLQSAIAASALLVRHVPGQDWHPIDACGRATIPGTGRTTMAWVSQVAELVKSQKTPKPTPDRRPAHPTLQTTLAPVLGTTTG